MRPLFPFIDFRRLRPKGLGMPVQQIRGISQISPSKSDRDLEALLEETLAFLAFWLSGYPVAGDPRQVSSPRIPAGRDANGRRVHVVSPLMYYASTDGAFRELAYDLGGGLVENL